MHIDHLEIVIRILAALVCGALLGAEREYRGREAGLKSHAGLAVACCLAIIVSAFGFSDAVTQGLIALDPSRIAAGVEGGIGFACAAVIWRSRSKVIGLTTAINIWATANIGMACGSGMFFAALVITGAMLFIHIVLGALEQQFFPRHNACSMSVSVTSDSKQMTQKLTALVKTSRAQLLAIRVELGDKENPTVLELELSKCPASACAQLLDSLRALDGVVAVTCSGICAAE
ncbi:MAG TPA: MgtC/SapB family protein [Planktothrix sp.]|jgi:putative Mg2+ transporter-C (MgtC) family protein